MRVVIVGGGIGGLSAAIALRRIGVDAQVYERALVIGEVGAGITLWSNAINALNKIGVGDDVLAHGVPITHSRLRTWRGRVLVGYDMSSLSTEPGAPSICIHRARLQSALLSRLCGDGVNRGKNCTDYRAESDKVTVAFEDGSEVECDLLIGADGLRSVVRYRLFGNIPPRYSGYTAWRGIATCESRDAPVGEANELWGRGMRFGWAHISPERIYWFATANRPEGEQDNPERRKQALAGRFKGWCEPVPTLINATKDSDILRNDVYDRPPIGEWGAGRVMLLGDAAHPTTPNMGQGACQAIEDAVALAYSLREHDDLSDAMRRYQSVRVGRANSIVIQSNRIGRAGQLQNPLACWTRDTMFRLIPNSVFGSRLKALLRNEL
jgi:2-polyprenyl-6-methoxyphenol hydroxylase-like FAD-dependent oxidoreductase